jgi:hypothetical protein
MALLFVIINNIDFHIQLFDNIIFEEFRKIINSSLLVFIAVDRIINGIQNWINEVCTFLF